MLEKVKAIPTINTLFYGIRPVALSLILTAGLNIVFNNILNFSNNIVTIIKSVIVFIVLLIGIRKTKTHPIWFIVISAIIGIICF